MPKRCCSSMFYGPLFLLRARSNELYGSVTKLSRKAHLVSLESPKSSAMFLCLAVPWICDFVQEFCPWFLRLHPIKTSRSIVDDILKCIVDRLQWRIQDFSEQGALTPKGGANLLFGQFFPKTEWKFPRAPHLRSATGLYWFNKSVRRGSPTRF